MYYLAQFFGWLAHFLYNTAPCTCDGTAQFSPNCKAHQMEHDLKDRLFWRVIAMQCFCYRHYYRHLTIWQVICMVYGSWSFERRQKEFEASRDCPDRAIDHRQELAFAEANHQSEEYGQGI